MLDNNYNESLKKAYIAKQEDDIDTINDFCEAYNEKLGVQEIADLLKLFNGQASTNEQNEFIVNMLDSIVKKEKQKAVNEIIEQSGILFQERATKCISLILTMIIFWNRDLDISLSESLAAAPNSIVKKEKQKAVNEIIEQSGILFQERATKCISLILTMIIFWNRDLDISLSESLAAAPNSIKDLYKKALEKKLLFMKGHNVQLIETILNSINISQDCNDI